MDHTYLNEPSLAILHQETKKIMFKNNLASYSVLVVIQIQISWNPRSKISLDVLIKNLVETERLLSSMFF
jgi:hypothetical protein